MIKSESYKRVKSTLSFCEMPNFLELKNGEFLILSFEKIGDMKESISRKRKYEAFCLFEA